jgi:hypothetical protein
VISALIDDERFWCPKNFEKALCVLKRTQLVELAGDAQVRLAYFLSVSSPGDRLGKLVEFSLIKNSPPYT